MGDLETFNSWLAWVEQFPIVPRWQWTQKSWQKWKEGLDRADIPHCRDTYGNILLGTQTVSKWFSEIKRNRIPLILQSHLDHPGALVTHRIDFSSDQKRHNALVQGGLHPKLKGKRFSLYDRDGSFIEEICIDAQREGFKERWITFQTAQEVSLPGFLRGPIQNNERIRKKDYLEGWGLDNHIGCAILLDYFSKPNRKNVLGFLTLDEEIGNCGILSFLREAKKFGITMQDWPLFLSIEITPEYPEMGFVCGLGPKWRSRDRHSELFVEDGPETVALQKGSCEAGLWARQVGKAACLVIPCEFSHNGLHEKEWRAEKVSTTDVLLLQEKLDAFISSEEIHKRKQYSTLVKDIPFPSDPIQIHDHLLPLREAAHPCNDYVEFLQNVLPLWNGVHARFNLPTLKFSYADWGYWKNKLLASEKWFRQVEEKTKKYGKEVKQWLSINESPVSPIPIHLFMCAPFNAANHGDGIALSVEKLKEKDLDRVLIHEITHWYTIPFVKEQGYWSLMQTMINEGLACKTTIDLLRLRDAQALGLSEEDYERYERHFNKLADYVWQWLRGDLFQVRKGRHEIVEPKKIPHPFLISQGGEFPKYGYFIGLKFVSEYLPLHKQHLSHHLDEISLQTLEGFLSQTQKGRKNDVCRNHPTVMANQPPPIFGNGGM